MYAKLTSSMLVRGKHTALSTVNFTPEDTWPGYQLEASRKQHEILCKRLKG